MPFTFAHPAAVMPIYEKARGRVDLTALVLGSMAPDFEYFIRGKPLGLIGHGALGMIYFNLPLCILFAYIFHKIIERPFVLNLPRRISIRLYQVICEQDKVWCISSFRGFIVFVYSALIGMITHVFWDGFTHKGGYFVNHIDVLNYAVPFAGRSIPAYKLMQHGSTAMGFIILAIWFYNTLITSENISVSKSRDTNFDRIKSNLSENSYIELSVREKITYFGIALALCLVVVAFIASTFRLTSIMSNMGAFVVALINGSAIGITISSIIYTKKVE